MPRVRLETCGDLREFLADTIVPLRTATIDPSQGVVISKLAANITASLLAEAQFGMAAATGGKPAQPGGLRIADPNRVQPLLGELPISLQVAKTFCEQCDKQVTAGEATACRSPFCKAKVAA